MNAAATRAHTTRFLFSDGDFFTALTDQNGVRIGMVAGVCFDVPRGHAYFDRIVEGDDRASVEAHFDELCGALL